MHVTMLARFSLFARSVLNTAPYGMQHELENNACNWTEGTFLCLAGGSQQIHNPEDKNGTAAFICGPHCLGGQEVALLLVIEAG